MDDAAFVRERIESYADYTNDDRRRLSDDQIRAYLGEALSRISERLALDTSAAESLERVLLRCQFADQRVVRALDSERIGAAAIAALHHADRTLVALADSADTVAPQAVEAFVRAVEAALDARSSGIISAADLVPPAPLLET